MARLLNWSEGQMAEALGYLANPQTEAHLEIQVPPDRKAGFEAQYINATGVLPPAEGEQGYSVLNSRSDKIGIQMRVYFAPSGEIPQHLVDIMKSASGERRRISRNNLVLSMLRAGFTCGGVDVERVRQHISPAHSHHFQRGFDAANR